MGFLDGTARRWLCLFPLFVLHPWVGLQAQDPEVIGAAIAAASQGIPDPEVHSGLGGTVSDSISGVFMPNASVRVTWLEDGEERSSETWTDGRGFFAFCGIPGNVEVEVQATLRVAGRPERIQTEAGMLHLVPLPLSLSDPAQPGDLIGRVIDADTRVPVHVASVFLLNEEVRTSSVTNEHGYFFLGSHPWGIYSIRTNHVAYGSRTSSVRVQGDMTEALEIEMSLTPIQLDELVVSATSRLKKWDMDGMPWPFELEFALTDFLADELEAVEVFRGHLEVPGEFRTTSDPCAVIAVWTRKGRGSP